MKKQELLAKIAEESGLNKTKVESVLKSLAATAKVEVVTKGEKSSKNYAGEIFKRCSALTQNIPSVGLGWI